MIVTSARQTGYSPYGRWRGCEPHGRWRGGNTLGGRPVAAEFSVCGIEDRLKPELQRAFVPSTQLRARSSRPVAEDRGFRPREADGEQGRLLRRVIAGDC